MSRVVAELEGLRPPEWFATHDPEGARLGSGGGAAHLLAAAWKATGGGCAFEEWLRSSRKLLLMGGGQSRRLPAYAPVGKMFLPVPVLRGEPGQRLDQTLLDLQLPGFQRILARARLHHQVLMTSGDVLLRFGEHLPPFPDVDVLGLGMWVRPEVAEGFGVFFEKRNAGGKLAFFLQKPSPSRVRELSADYVSLVDTGMWLLSAKAVGVLMRKSGVPEGRGEARPYELYAEFGLALGESPQAPDPEISTLTSAVVPLPQAEFFHLGTSRQLIESLAALQNTELDQFKAGGFANKPHPHQFVLNSDFAFLGRSPSQSNIWVENSAIGESWKLVRDHMITNVPPNSWALALAAGDCLDCVPTVDGGWCVRTYGFDDAFRGDMADPSTLWMGRPAGDWFVARGIDPEAYGLGRGVDLQQARLFPIVAPEDLETLAGRLAAWMLAETPGPALRDAWRSLPRLSAQDIMDRIDLARLYRNRLEYQSAAISRMMRNFRANNFFSLDLAATAHLAGSSSAVVEPELPPFADSPQDRLACVHARMFRAALRRECRRADWQADEQEAFAILRQLIIDKEQATPASPLNTLLEDQILWARSPVRLDLAGGWSDTPPFCLEHGGRVLNLAVELNGQAPVQVFARLNERPEIVLRSIDRGCEERIRTYEELDTFAVAGGDFSLAKAALALAGFLPRFHMAGGAATLEAHMRNFGGGLELSMLAAAPKGSGLGTSSILAATLLGALSEVAGLGWDHRALFSRTLALEQMLTTGGGWQDQAGGLYRGIKLIETSPGFEQAPTLRWLPERLFAEPEANRSILLYYTGLTRLAKNILQEIVRGMFLNSRQHLGIVREIASVAGTAFQAIQTHNRADLCACVRESWRLNQALDSGTNPPEVQAILRQVEDWVDAAKLLGAGGGGYLVIFAKDPMAAARLRHSLTRHPPNPKARFVDFRISDLGLHITRS